MKYCVHTDYCKLAPTKEEIVLENRSFSTKLFQFVHAVCWFEIPIWVQLSIILPWFYQFGLKNCENVYHKLPSLFSCSIFCLTHGQRSPNIQFSHQEVRKLPNIHISAAETIEKQCIKVAQCRFGEVIMIHHWINKLFSGGKQGRTPPLEARKVAGSATYKQSKTVWSGAVL